MSLTDTHSDPGLLRWLQSDIRQLVANFIDKPPRQVFSHPQ